MMTMKTGRAVAGAVMVLMLVGCGTGREWVSQDRVSTEIGEQQKRVIAILAQAQDSRVRNRAYIAEGALVAASRALEAGNMDRAQQELQVAVDVLNATKHP